MQKPAYYFRALCWFTSLFLFSSACREKEPAPVYRVPAEMEPYIQAFLAEARLRGKEIRIDNLIVEFGATEREEICGECLQTPGKPGRQKRIRIGTQATCWQEFTPPVREGLVFHELGHCILGRINHKDIRLPNGDFSSLMNTTNVNVYGPCEYDLGGDSTCDQRFKRSYYLDELFDENTAIPGWAR